MDITMLHHAASLLPVDVLRQSKHCMLDNINFNKVNINNLYITKKYYSDYLVCISRFYVS